MAHLGVDLRVASEVVGPGCSSWVGTGDWPAWLGQGRRCLAPPVELPTAPCVSTWTLPRPVRPRHVVARWVDPVAVAELMLCGAGWVMGDVGMMGQDALSLESRAPWASGTTLTRTLRVALFRPLPVGTPWEMLSGPSRSHKSCGHRLHCCAGPTSGTTTWRHPAVAGHGTLCCLGGWKKVPGQVWRWWGWPGTGELGGDWWSPRADRLGLCWRQALVRGPPSGQAELGCSGA